MGHFVLLILISFLQYSSCKYIQCTSHCSQITVSFLQPLSIPFQCQENQKLIYDTALICMIDYRIDYDNQQIYINFKSTNDTEQIFKEFNQTEALIQSIWLGFTRDSDQPNITHRSYSCSTENDCARLFYFDTIEYLITDGRNTLNRISSILYNHTRSKNYRCINNLKSTNRSSVRCSKGLCYAHSHDHKQYCTSDLTPMFFSEIQYQIPPLASNRRELVEYKCNKNHCNRNSTIAKIHHLLLDYTNWQQIQEKSSSCQQILSSFIVFSLSLLFNLRV